MARIRQPRYPAAPVASFLMGLVGEFYHRNYSLLTRIAQPGGVIKQRSIAEAKVATITLIILLAVIAYGLFRTGRSTIASQTTPGGTSAQEEQGSVICQNAAEQVTSGGREYRDQIASRKSRLITLEDELQTQLQDAGTVGGVGVQEVASSDAVRISGRIRGVTVATHCIVNECPLGAPFLSLLKE